MTDLSEDVVDHTFDLPEDVVDYIISKLGLTSKEVIQLGLVSKQFHRILQKHSALIFYESDSHPEEQLKYMISTLLGYRKHGVHLDKFAFELYNNFPSRTDNGCIKLAATQKGLRYLNIVMPEPKKIRCRYSLPRHVFEADSLVDLTLTNCKMLLPERIAWRNLRRLKLDDVYIGEGVFENVMRSCLLIEILHFNGCYGDIPLDYLNASTYLGQPLYQNLKKLTVGFLRTLPKESNLILNFAQLETLYLVNNYNESINVSSPSLKMLDYMFLDRYIPSQKAHFDVPNIVSFNFSWIWRTYEKFQKEIHIPKLSFTGKSSGWISTITLHIREVCSSWLIELKEILKALAGALNDSEIASVTLSFNETIMPKGDHDMKKFPDEIIPGIPELHIDSSNMGFSLASAQAVLDGVFLICHPKTVTFQHSNGELESSQEFQHDVRFPTSDHREEFMEVLRDHEKEDEFTVVFNLEY